MSSMKVPLAGTHKKSFFSETRNVEFEKLLQFWMDMGCFSLASSHLMILIVLWYFDDDVIIF